MTVATAYAPAELAWTGVETSFVPGFSAQDSSYVTILFRAADGAETPLTENVHYAVTLGVNDAVTVIPLSLPAAPGTLVVTRVTPPTQPTDFSGLSSFDGAVHTRRHDAAAMRAGEYSYRIGVLEAALNAGGGGLSLRGGWDASAASFPGAGGALRGYEYIVTVAGTVDGVAFDLNDRVVALVDNASTSTYAGNWLRLSASEVTSVAGRTGAVTLGYADLVDIATSRLLGRTTAGTGAAELLTVSQALDLLSAAANGRLPLRSGGSWVAATPSELLDLLSGAADGSVPYRSGGTWTANSWSGARVRKNATLTGQNLTSLTTIAWDTEDEDVGGWHESVTNPSRLTVPAGVTRVKAAAYLELANCTSGEWAYLAILVNGGTVPASGLPAQRISAASTSHSLYVETAEYPAAAGAYFEVKAQVQSDTSVDISNRSWFAIKAVR